MVFGGRTFVGRLGLDEIMWGVSMGKLVTLLEWSGSLSLPCDAPHHLCCSVRVLPDADTILWGFLSQINLCSLQTTQPWVFCYDNRKETKKFQILEGIICLMKPIGGTDEKPSWVSGSND